MPCLSKLNLRNCLKLDRLPHLPSLKEFSISDLERGTLPDGGWEGLVTLETLFIYSFEKLESLPEGLGQLKKLKSLTIFGCEKLESLPHSFGQLEVLNELEIRDCNELGSLPHGLQHLSHLQMLVIYNCPLLSERCKREGGPDWSKISRIPNINIDGEWIQEQRRWVRLITITIPS
ncbi:hypothetical protein ACLOJK_038001 [Asimina triloba]